MALTQAQRAHLLKDVGLFSGTGARGRAAIGGRSVEVVFPKGKRIARQGEIEAGFFLIVTGSVSVIRDGEVLARLGPGQFFGELSLIDGEARVASVVADEPTICLALPAWDFQRLLESEPRIAAAVLKEVTRRLRALSAESHN